MDVAQIIQEPEIQPLRWSAQGFMALIEANMIEDPRRVELLDGMMVKEMPQGEIHRFIFAALQRVFAASGGIGQGLEIMPTILLKEQSVVEPEFALLREETISRLQLPTEADVLWVGEVAFASLRKDLGPKKALYADAGIQHYWVFDGIRRGIWIFETPAESGYRSERFVEMGESVEIPFLGGALDTISIFPPSGVMNPQKGLG
jgi:Uma2 family endonuclease